MNITHNNSAEKDKKVITPDNRESEVTKLLEESRDLIYRSYLAELETYAVMEVPFQVDISNDVQIFRLERLVRENKQSVLESATAVYTALGVAGHTAFLLLDSDGKKTDVYLGVRGEIGKITGGNAGELLEKSFAGHFGGSHLVNLSDKDAGALLQQIENSPTTLDSSITSVTSVPSLTTEDREVFVQGLERFINAAEGSRYQAMILAESVATSDLYRARLGYEQVATKLSPLQKMHISYGEQESSSIGMNITTSLSETLGKSISLTTTTGTSSTESSSDKVASSKVAQGVAIGLTGIGAAIGSVVPVVGTMAGGLIGGALGGALTTFFGATETKGTSNNASTAKTEAVNDSDTKTVTEGKLYNTGIGTTNQYSIEENNKSIEQLLKKIDSHLERIDEAQTYGGWNAAAYFIGDSIASSESLASLFLGLMRGGKSSHEDFALTTWKKVDDKIAVSQWLSNLSHPQMKAETYSFVPVSFLTPATLVSGREVAILLGLPRHSTSTVAVLEVKAFGRKVQRLDIGVTPQSTSKKKTLMLGHIHHLWKTMPQTIELDISQLASHVFISGSTGAGKSNTLYAMLEQVQKHGVKFMVIEPAKGEYKHVFGMGDDGKVRKDVRVLGTNPKESELLRINPFAFPENIHVLEHIDRLVEIFNVCWPMYAAMPAVLKDSILQCYEQCGWDMTESINQYGSKFFPCFSDLLETMKQVIADSAYSQEMKSNYEGALVTRIKSLTNGLNGQIFSTNEIGCHDLFNSNVIVDLSRVGSSETKSLIMGVLIMRLAEYRMSQGNMNAPLQHITVLEEAHNILRKNPESGAEGAGVQAKAVEMLTNAIAEMRTYGEGFIIVDQSPNAVDVAAIRNTNTKIIMRLPDEADRRLLGKSAALTDEQIDEIARLPKGVAVVYQNDWLEPVLCCIDKFNWNEKIYSCPPSAVLPFKREDFNREMLKLLLAYRATLENYDDRIIELGLKELPLLTKQKILLQEAKKNSSNKNYYLWSDFGSLSSIIVRLLDCREQVKCAARLAEDFTDLNARLDDFLREQGLAHFGVSLSHCLMKDYSLQGKDNLEIYAAWRYELAAEKTK